MRRKKGIVVGGKTGGVKGPYQRDPRPREPMRAGSNETPIRFGSNILIKHAGIMQQDNTRPRKDSI